MGGGGTSSVKEGQEREDVNFLSCVHLGRGNSLYSMGRFERTDMLPGMCSKYCTPEGCQTSATLVLASAEICMRSMKRSVVVSRCGCGGGGK